MKIKETKEKSEKSNGKKTGQKRALSVKKRGFTQASVGIQVEPNSTKQYRNQRGRRWCLTVHGARPEDCPILVALKAEFQTDAYTCAAVAYETGKHGIHPHWQIYFQTESVCGMKARLAQVLGEQVGFHVKVADGTQRANLKYIYAVHKQHEIGWVHYTKNVLPPADYVPQKTENLLWLRSNMKPWQRMVTTWVTGRADYRTIYWVWEPVGDTGKSYLAKYLHYFHGAILTGGSTSDMKHAIARWNEITGHYPVTILLDVARGDRITKPAFKGLEEIKNAMFFSGKYESTMVASCNPPHVVVFANQPPNRSFMSSDRWAVYRIDPFTQTLIPHG